MTIQWLEQKVISSPVENTPRQNRVRSKEPLVHRESNKQDAANNEHSNERRYASRPRQLRLQTVTIARVLTIIVAIVRARRQRERKQKQRPRETQQNQTESVNCGQNFEEDLQGGSTLDGRGGTGGRGS